MAKELYELLITIKNHLGALSKLMYNGASFWVFLNTLFGICGTLTILSYLLLVGFNYSLIWILLLLLKLRLGVYTLIILLGFVSYRLCFTICLLLICLGALCSTNIRDSRWNLSSTTTLSIFVPKLRLLILCFLAVIGRFCFCLNYTYVSLASSYCEIRELLVLLLMASDQKTNEAPKRLFHFIVLLFAHGNFVAEAGWTQRAAPSSLFLLNLDLLGLCRVGTRSSLAFCLSRFLGLTGHLLSIFSVIVFRSWLLDSRCFSCLSSTRYFLCAICGGLGLVSSSVLVGLLCFCHWLADLCVLYRRANFGRLVLCASASWALSWCSHACCWASFAPFWWLSHGLVSWGSFGPWCLTHSLWRCLCFLSLSRYHEFQKIYLNLPDWRCSFIVWAALVTYCRIYFKILSIRN